MNLLKETIKIDIDLLSKEYVDFDNKKSIGRPLFNGKNEKLVVTKLEWAFSIGSTVKEACNYAGISTDSLYRYFNKQPEFRNRIEVLKSKPMLIVRKTIYDSLVSGNIKTALWYAERKCPEEFSVGGSPRYLLEEKEERVRYLENILRDNNIKF